MANAHLTTEALSRCCIPRRTTPISQQQPHRTSLHHRQSRFFYAERRSRFDFRVSAGIKEKGSVAERNNDKVATGFLLDDEMDEEIVSASDKRGGFELNFPHVPQRYRLIGATALAFVVCNMDKVNLSIAIIPMSHQFGWNSSTAGLVQSSFFWGYALSQLPGGWLAKIFGGRKVLQIGVLVWSLATACVPLLAGYMPGLVLSRILVGIGEGVSPSAATDLIARTIPLEERSRAVSFVFGGLSVGSVVGFIVAPSLIQSLGWGSVFYIFGFIGIAWFLGFQLVTDEEPTLADEDVPRFQPMFTTKSQDSSLTELAASVMDVPWKSFFMSPAVWAMIYAHFCGSWGHYTCLSWLPTYFSEVLDLNLTEAAWVSVLPPLASIVVTSLAAQLADHLIGSGVDTTKVRKICQSIAFISPAICMILSSLDLGLPPWEVVGILTGGLALSSFALSGLYCTHQDISPEYASILLGITNTVGAVPGIVGVALTGFLLDATHSWSLYGWHLPAVSLKSSSKAIDFSKTKGLQRNSIQAVGVEDTLRTLAF
ncbi:unnamed protein product [Rhodiola kirilowii]